MTVTLDSAMQQAGSGASRPERYNDNLTGKD